MYEYKVDIYKIKYAQEAMNAYAKEGWRVVAVSPDHQEGFVDVFFEREPVVEKVEENVIAEAAVTTDTITAATAETANSEANWFDEPAEEVVFDAPETKEAESDEPEPVIDFSSPMEPVDMSDPQFANPWSLEVLPYSLTICKVSHIENIDPSTDFFFIAKSEREVSLVCETDKTPFSTVARDDGWKAIRIIDSIPLTNVGIVSDMSGILAKNNIPIFAVSTHDTQYVLVKEENFENAIKALETNCYKIKREQA